MLLYVHRDNQDFQGRGAQDGHLDILTVPELQMYTASEINHLYPRHLAHTTKTTQTATN